MRAGNNSRLENFLELGVKFLQEIFVEF